jgi:hypothetical protein
MTRNTILPLIVLVLGLALGSLALAGDDACNDGIDNDGDGLVDMVDFGCFEPDDDSERCDPGEEDEGPCPECDDGIDNDRDGATDFPDDAQCLTPWQDDEALPAPACADGNDNDGDGKADYPADPGCLGPDDPTETDPLLICDDGLDNNGNGYTDWPHEPGCLSQTDPTETCLWTDPECWEGIDGFDNDGDTLIDYPADDGTQHGGPWATELADCWDGVDNDGDGRVDYRDDPGCQGEKSHFYEDPQCNDGVDNDGDTTVDTADPDCAVASGQSELPRPVSTGTACGLGAEQALLFLGAFWLVLSFVRLLRGAKRYHSFGPVLLAMLLLGGCAPSRFGQLQAHAVNHIVTAPATATHADGWTFDNPYARAAVYPLVVPMHIGVGAVEFWVSPGCDFFSPIFGECHPWHRNPPYIVIADEWAGE